MNKEQFELLAPAGDLEKLKTAIIYGADAVYFGGEMFSLRAGAGNLTIEEMKEGIAFAHERGKRCYLTINIFAHNEDIEPLTSYLQQIKDLGLDAFIVSDPGIVDLIQEVIPAAEIHLSTQANMTNYRTAGFWHKLGVKRLVLARELTLPEIRQIRENIPPEMEIEAFVHGAMCISYSGRCLLSNFMIERDANRGMCAHPCRWKYALVEEKRPGEYYPVEEDERGTYILNSRDLCMIEHIPEIVGSGIMSAKIEGRMKSIFYVATVVHAYRKAIDAYFADPEHYKFDEDWMRELKKVSHREFTTGFYFHQPTNKDQNYQTSAYTREYSFVGLIKEYDEETGFALVEQRNKMTLGEEIEIFGPDIDFFTQNITEMLDAQTGENLESAPHPQQLLKMKMDHPVKPHYILRKKK
ncbi:MAG: U32 family peptidase [Emergencia sp.]|jgi:putative protease|uniref:U32 family peptidase n=1 Tax=Anaerotruncus colihominis TaxID=169435 RepID=A0A845QK93_9FIRM|nr:MULTISPECIES: U32 family peptidase [Clostridia]MCI9476492.1 U32 family peptidase [Emergencia sp.]NBH61173.1 U32 family peptidase [Anaerotruncus colihominis]NCE98984.1 U32 family peptidase [Emergencia sp. 1XD21-10]NCF01828.1 U32 family peptidase [Anaerotruncus sp. 80]